MVFEAYERKAEPQAIIARQREVQIPLGESISIAQEEKKAQRVWNGLEKKTSKKNARLVSIAFLAGEAGKEMLLWRYLQKIFSQGQPGVYQNMLDDDVYELVQMARRVKHEVHRFHGFVRFQQTADGIYFAAIDPDHDITRLLVNHFKARYADQPWVIYDTGRHYGVYWDTNMVMEVMLENPAFDKITGKLDRQARAVDQDHYSQLWKAYYDAINILERQNHRQMKRAMPQRYWKYLPEKE